MSEDKCPFCQRSGSMGVNGVIVFGCGSRHYNQGRGELERSAKCYETQISQLQVELEEINLKDRGKTNEINILTKENRSLWEQIQVAAEWINRFKAQLEEARGIMAMALLIAVILVIGRLVCGLLGIKE